MASYRVQIGFPMDSDFPRDVVSINPHYTGENPQALADLLVSRIQALSAVGASTPMIVKVYDATKAPPSYPLATRVSGTGHRVTTHPREVALCLSYYAVNNRPSQRGRLYIPATFIGGSLGLQPTQTQIDNTVAWSTALNTPIDTGVWSVWSKKHKTMMGAVDNIWVDNEWDTVRSRGLKASARTTAPITHP
jgi:hypothetical protein